MFQYVMVVLNYAPESQNTMSGRGRPIKHLLLQVTLCYMKFRNDMIFNTQTLIHFLQVIYITTAWIHT